MLISKNVLFLIGILSLSTAVSGYSEQIGDLLRDGSGQVQFMNQRLAGRACAAKNGRLPTIREFAQESQSNGAKGILEVGQVDPGNVPPGYDRIWAKNPDGNIDIFYYNRDGYRPPQGDLGRHIVWSASWIDSFDGLAFSSSYGELDFWDREEFRAAVRCVGIGFRE